MSLSLLLLHTNDILINDIIIKNIGQCVSLNIKVLQLISSIDSAKLNLKR